MSGPPGLYAPSLSAGGEKELLHAHLRLNRDVMLWKLENLPELEIRKPMTTTGTNLIGLVKHLTGIEAAYLCTAFGRERPHLPWEHDEDSTLGEFSDMYAKPEETAAEIVANYRATAAAADRTIDALDLDTMGAHPAAGVSVSLRWMMLIVLTDTARHAGHADIIREAADGATGHTRWNPPTDVEHRDTYLARVRGEIDTPTWFDLVRQRHRQ